MKHLPQFPSILAICCFCMLHIPSSGFSRPLPDPPDGLDIVQLERLAYWAMLSRQPKDNQDIYKRFLFHYSRTQEPTYAVKTGFPPVHPLMRLAAKLANRKVKRYLQHLILATLEWNNEHSRMTEELIDVVPVKLNCTSFPYPKPRNRRTTEENNQSSFSAPFAALGSTETPMAPWQKQAVLRKHRCHLFHAGPVQVFVSSHSYFNGTGKLDQMRQSSNYFKQMLNFFL